MLAKNIWSFQIDLVDSPRIIPYFSYIGTVNIICVDKILSNIQNVCIKHSEDRKAWYVHIYYTGVTSFETFKLSTEERGVSRAVWKWEWCHTKCNKYEHTTLSYLLSVLEYNINLPE